MTRKYGVFICDFPESNNKGKLFFNEISRYINQLYNTYESIWIPDHVAPYLTPHNDDMIEALIRCFTSFVRFVSAEKISVLNTDIKKEFNWLENFV